MLSAYLRAYNSYEQMDIRSPLRAPGFDRSRATIFFQTHFAAFGSPTAPRSSVPRRASACDSSFGDLHRQVGGILTDPSEQARPRRVQPVQPENVEPRHTRHAPPLDRVAVRIQDGETDPFQIRAVAHRPDEGADPRVR